MKKETIEHALNQVDDAFIEEAAGIDAAHPVGKKKVKWAWIAGYAAAAAVLIVGLVFFLGRNGTERTLNEQGQSGSSVQSTDPSGQGKPGNVPASTEDATTKPSATTEQATTKTTERPSTEKATEAATEAPAVTPEPAQDPQSQQPAQQQEPQNPGRQEPVQPQPTQPEEPATEEPKEDQPEGSKYGAEINNISKNMQQGDYAGTNISQSHQKALASSGLQLLQKTVQLGKDGNKNYLISPTSIQMALGMTAAGADSGTRTEKELLSVLMPGAKSVKALNKEMAAFSGKMKNAEGVAWNVANSIWVNNNGEVTLRDSYVKDVVNYYGAELYTAPFNDKTVDAINTWVSDNTKKRIPAIISELNDEARMVLVNAVAFDGKWANEYQKDQIEKNRKFTNADGSESKVVMLSSVEERAIKLAGGLGFIRPYQGGQYSFVGILPPEGMTTEEYLTKIVSSGKNFADAYRNSLSGRVYVELPEFKTECGTDMDSVLKGLGVKRAYADGQFKQMVTEDSVPVTIGSVLHKAMINVNRKGTEAAAATAVIMNKATAIPVEEKEYHITLDRPFVYAIVDNATGVPVFVGVQNTME